MDAFNAIMPVLETCEEPVAKRARIDDGAYKTPKIDSRALIIMRLREKIEARHYFMHFWNQLQSPQPADPFESTLLKASTASAEICAVPGCAAEAKRKWCDDHKKSKVCKHEDCVKCPSYNIPGAGAQYCGKHAKPGMENVISKRCVENGCKKQPSYGFEGGKATHCCKHAKPGMEDVKSKRCDEDACEMRPMYGFEWGKATHCCKHAKPGMEDVVSKRCEEDGCDTRPCYGFEGGKATHCCKHAKPGMEDVLHPKCEEGECGTRPTYGFERGKATHCCRHAKPGMEDVLHPKCEEDGCNTQPSFGFEWGKATHCCKHAKPGMEDVKNKRCEEDGCDTQSTYGFEGGEATHCCKHAKPGMEDVKNKRCEEDGCDTQPCYGFERGKATHCCKHAKEGMEDVVNKRCEEDDCDTHPSYGFKGGNATHCCKHAKPGMEDVVSKRCEHGRLLASCLGDACGKKIAGHSEEELFTNAAAWIAWGESSDAVAEFLKALNVRIYFDDGAQSRMLKPDLCLVNQKLIHEHDGFLYHKDSEDNDLRKNMAYASQGFTVHRTRVGDIGSVDGSRNVLVSERDSRENMARATFNGICATSEEQWQKIWRSVDSLVRRALIAAQKDGQQFIDTCFA